MTKHFSFAVLAAAFVALVCLAPVNAAELGRVELDGQTIIINDDNTWEYAEGGDAAEAGENAAGDCVTIASEVVPFSFCLDPDEWVRADLGDGMEHQFQSKADTEQYMIVISEKDFVDPEILTKAVLVNAQRAAGLSKVTTLSQDTLPVAGNLIKKIVYQTIVDGQDLTYANFHTSLENTGSIQIVFWAASDDFQNYEPLIDKVADTIAMTN